MPGNFEGYNDSYNVYIYVGAWKELKRIWHFCEARGDFDNSILSENHQED